jgi:hypothetical protein
MSLFSKKSSPPDWQEDWILVEDNDGPHSTRGKTYNKVKQAKTCLGIKWEANTPNSPDLNPIESMEDNQAAFEEQGGSSTKSASYAAPSRRNGID